MQKISKRQLDAVKRVYPNVKYSTTKRYAYLVGDKATLTKYMRCISGDLTNRQLKRQDDNQRRNVHIWA